MSMLQMIFVLLIVFQIKHFAADYILQGRYMLGKFAPGWEFVRPLAAHAGVHAAFTAYITWSVTQHWLLSLELALLDFGVHFAMDRIKASPKYWGRYKPHQRQFWWALGADQGVHHLCHYLLIWAMLMAGEGQ